MVDSIHNNKSWLGFGDHANVVDEAGYQQAKKIAAIALVVLGLAVIGSGVVVASIFLPVIPFVIVPSLAPIVISSTVSSASLAAVVSLVHLKRQENAFFGAMNGINEQIVSPPVQLGEYSESRVIACINGQESFEWKKKLIQAAEKNIVLSGNYCGGHAFDEVLNLIREQLNSKPDLKVVIISADLFINEENKKIIADLNDKFKDRFQLVKSPDIWHVNPGIKKTTNHSKFLSIDYGNVFLLGGSGLEDKYAYMDGLGNSPEKKPCEVKGMVGKLLPDAFRDQDFVFSSVSNNGVGRRVYIEALKLALRWQGMNESTSISIERTSNDANKSSSVVAKSLLLDETAESVSERILAPIVNKFEREMKDAVSSQTKILCIGPEHKENQFEQELFERIENANTRIVIDHLYFHPTEKILDALEQAAKRGVDITIVTNGAGENSPKTHAVFVPRSQYNYYLLAKRIGKEYKNKLKIFEFVVDRTTLHKKVMVVDDYVIGGSSNLGYKSLVSMSDHEINFVSQSQELADKTVEGLAVDMLSEQEPLLSNEQAQPGADLEIKKRAVYAKRIVDPEQTPSFSIVIKAAMHRIGALLIG